MRTRLSILILFTLIAAACGGAGPLDDPAGGGGQSQASDGASDASEVAASTCAEGETDGDIVLYNWTEYMDPKLLKAFAKEHGVKVTEDFYGSNEELLAKLQGGATGYDVIVPSDYMVSIMIKEGVLLKLSEEAIPNRENIHSDFAAPPYDPELAYSMPFQFGTTGLGVNVEELGDDFPRSWSLIFDPEVADQYKGRIQLLDDPREVMGAALKYLGYSLNETDDEKLQEAADLVQAASQRVVAFNSDTYSDFLVEGETVIGHGFSGTWLFGFIEAENPDHYEYFVPEEGGTIWTDNMAVTANSEHPCSSQTFMNFILDADNGAQLSNWTYYETPNGAARPNVDKVVTDLAKNIPPDVQEKLEFIEDTGDDEIKFNDLYNRAKG